MGLQEVKYYTKVLMKLYDDMKTMIGQLLLNERLLTRTGDEVIQTHNTDLIRLLDVQLNNCFNLYILNNVEDGENGFIPVSEKEKK